jgi:hypothetical protein
MVVGNVADVLEVHATPSRSKSRGWRVSACIQYSVLNGNRGRAEASGDWYPVWASRNRGQGKLSTNCRSTTTPKQPACSQLRVQRLSINQARETLLQHGRRTGI